MELERLTPEEAKTVELWQVFLDGLLSLKFAFFVTLVTLKIILNGLVGLLKTVTLTILSGLHQMSLGTIAVLLLLIHFVISIYPFRTLVEFSKQLVFQCNISVSRWILTYPGITLRQALTCHQLGGVTVRHAPLFCRWWCRISIDLVKLLFAAVWPRRLPAPVTGCGL